MKKITIVGVGALGSHLTMLLRSCNASLKVVDFDRVESKNILSQFHGKPNVGKLKVDSLKQAMQFLFGIRLEAVPAKLVDNNVDALLSKCDLVVDCLDNGEARRLVQGFVRAHSVPCVHGALSPDGTFGQVIWDEDFRVDDENVEGAATCENGEHLPFISVVSSFLARSVQDFVRNDKKVGYQVHLSGARRI